MILAALSFNALSNRLVRTVQKLPNYCRFGISDFGNKEVYTSEIQNPTSEINGFVLYYVTVPNTFIKKLTCKHSLN